MIPKRIAKGVFSKKHLRAARMSVDQDYKKAPRADRWSPKSHGSEPDASPSPEVHVQVWLALTVTAADLADLAAVSGSRLKMVN